MKPEGSNGPARWGVVFEIRPRVQVMSIAPADSASLVSIGALTALASCATADIGDRWRRTAYDPSNSTRPRYVYNASVPWGPKT